MYKKLNQISVQDIHQIFHESNIERLHHILEESPHQDYSVLHMAANLNRPEIIKIILDYGFDIEFKNHDNDSALTVASRLGNLDCVKILIEYGANVNDKSNTNWDGFGTGFETHPIFWATTRGHVEIVRLLVLNGADLSGKYRNGSGLIEIANRLSFFNSKDGKRSYKSESHIQIEEILKAGGMVFSWK